MGLKGMFNLERMGIDMTKLGTVDTVSERPLEKFEPAPKDKYDIGEPTTRTTEEGANIGEPVTRDANAEPSEAELAASATYAGVSVDQYKKMIADREGE